LAWGVKSLGQGKNVEPVTKSEQIEIPLAELPAVTYRALLEPLGDEVMIQFGWFWTLQED
jgi:hypothetical protein